MQQRPSIHDIGIVVYPLIPFNQVKNDGPWSWTAGMSSTIFIFATLFSAYLKEL